MPEIERIIRAAARLAQQRRRKLTSIDKSNVLETSRLWREVSERVVQAEFPEVALEHMLVDAAAIILPSQEAASLLGSNVAQARRLERELAIFKKAYHVPTVIYALEP